MGVYDAALLRIFDKGFQMVYSESVMPFPHRILPAVLTLMLAGWSRVPHFPIHTSPDQRLSCGDLGVNLIIPLKEHSVGYRGIFSFISSPCCRASVLHVVYRNRNPRLFVALAKQILPHLELLIYSCLVNICSLKALCKITL